MIINILRAAFAGILSLGALHAAPFSIDKAHSSVAFEVIHLSISRVRGGFEEYDLIKADIDTKKNIVNALEGNVVITSANTNNAKRDEELKEPAFFNAGTYPKATFKLTSFKKLNDTNVEVTADINLKGVTKAIKFKGKLIGPVQHPMLKKQIYGLQLAGTLNRRDFKIADSFSNIMVSDNVEAFINLELVES